MTTIVCVRCGQGIKNAVSEAGKFQAGNPSTVVVDGPDMYHASCHKAMTGKRGGRPKSITAEQVQDMAKKINNQADFDAVETVEIVEISCPSCGKTMTFEKFFDALPDGCSACREMPRTGLLDAARRANGEEA